MNFKHLRKADGTVWRITKLRIMEASLVDNPANDMATIEEMELAKRYTQEQRHTMSYIRPSIAKFLRDRGFGYLVKNDDLPVFLKGAANPATGTSTDSGGDGGPDNEAGPLIDAALEAVREVLKDPTVLTSGKPGDPAVSYDEVMERVAEALKRRLGAPQITDRSADDGDDGSLFPTSPGVAAAGARAGTGPDGIIEQINRVPNGYELAKRLRTLNDGVALVRKLNDAGQTPVAGGAAGLLKCEAESELRKLEFGAGAADFSKVISEPGDVELIKRLSERDAQVG